MISKEEYECILGKCKLLPPASDIYIVDDYITNLFFTVLDFQMHATSVGKAYNHYNNNHWDEIRSLDDLSHLLERYTDDKEGNTELALYLWGYRYWNRVVLLRRLVCCFISIDVTTQEQLRSWAEKSTFENDFQGRVHGMGFAIYQWLIMRQGIETIKPDTMVKRFLFSLIQRNISEQEIVDLFERIAKELCIKAYELDWRIWEYQRAQ